MTVELLMNPAVLTWDDYLVVDALIDPQDGSRISALTNFEWDWPPKDPVKKDDGQVGFPDTTLMISPDASIWKDSVARKDKAKGDALLSHEQFHYDVAHVIGRVVAKQLEALRAKDAGGLDAAADVLFKRHFITRGKLIHRRYDLETNHGLEPNYQKSWKKMMEATLANKNALTMGGWWL